MKISVLGLVAVSAAILGLAGCGGSANAPLTNSDVSENTATNAINHPATTTNGHVVGNAASVGNNVSNGVAGNTSQ